MSALKPALLKTPGVVGKETIVTLDPSRVVIVKDRNTRFDLGDIDSLAESIAANGVQQPITVQITSEGEIQLVDGHRRMAAIERCTSRGMQIKLSAIVLPPEITEKQILQRMLIANDGKTFAPIEEAIMLSRMKVEFGMTNKEIAESIGKSLSHVNDRLALINADSSVQEAVKEGTVSVGDAVTIIRRSHKDKGKQKEMIEKVKAEGNSVVSTELKAGRMSKEQKVVAKKAYDEFVELITKVSTEKGLSVADAMAEIKALIDGDQTELIGGFSDQQKQIFLLGRLTGVAEMSYIPVQELVAKLVSTS